MKRRDALQRVALMMGGVVSAPTLVAILDGCKSSGEASSSGFSLSKDFQALISEIAEVIIPKTDTPGAKDAGVGPFIEMMLKDCYTEAQQQHFVKGLETVEEEAKKLGSNFIGLSADKKTEVIKIMRDKAKTESEANTKAKEVDSESGLVKQSTSKKEEPPVPFFTLAKELTVFGFFTSEPGATQTLDFIPIPGRYEGCIKMKPGQKAYAI